MGRNAFNLLCMAVDNPAFGTGEIRCCKSGRVRSVAEVRHCAGKACLRMVLPYRGFEGSEDAGGKLHTLRISEWHFKIVTSWLR
ncbi:MAG: hypothetical protein ACLRTD_10445 [Bacteroides sp.]